VNLYLSAGIRRARRLDDFVAGKSILPLVTVCHKV